MLFTKNFTQLVRKKNSGLVEVVQLWMNTAKRSSYEDSLRSISKFMDFDDNVEVGLYAGSFDNDLDVHSPLEEVTDVNIYQAKFLRDSVKTFHVNEGSTTLVFQVEGTSNLSNGSLLQGELAVYSKIGSEFTISAKKGTKILVFNAEEIFEKRLSSTPINTKSDNGVFHII